MDTILFFSLIFASYDANQKELEGSSCQVEQLPGLFPRDMRSIRVLLIQVLKINDMEGLQAPGHNQIVANLQCLGSGRKVIVNLQDSEKRPKTRYTLKSLSVMTAPPQDSPSRLRCYLSTAPKMWFQGGLFLPNISNCKFYPVVEDSSEGLTATSIITTAPEDKEERPTITGNYSFVEQQDPDEDLLMRQKWSIVVKALIAITLLISGVAITVFVIFEVPCPVSLLLMMKPWPTGSRETVLFPSSSSNPKVSNSSSPKMAAEIIVIHQTYF
uniref:Chromosome 17 open reading frame 78 n=1 Tax=Monodelphis domestica TaxID=13616 RepID=A0A5F8HD51_MONDO